MQEELRQTPSRNLSVAGLVQACPFVLRERTANSAIVNTIGAKSPSQHCRM